MLQNLVKKKTTLQTFIIAIIILTNCNLYAQMPPGGAPKGGFDPSKMNIGRFYGKIVDDKGKGVGYATITLSGKKFEPTTKSLKDTLYAGQLTEDNGDFSLENLPVVGEFVLKVSFMGYEELTKTVDFGMKMPTGKPQGNVPPSGGFGGANFDKDLGNLLMKEDVKTLNEVVVTARASTATIAIDKKSYKIDKDLSTTGGTAIDAMKNVPSVSVDVDGNVSLRNGAPQIFVDGKQSTLTLDQIAADAIESVEVITNPSSKFDAGGGTAGIINIVLKKEKKLGYNGNVRTGTDSRLGYNLGGDINARGSKTNLFAAVNINGNKGKGNGTTVRNNFFGSPYSDVYQTTNNTMKGLFANGRIGLDYFLDNRNTVTLSSNFMRGKFKPQDVLKSETSYKYETGTVLESFERVSSPDRNFRNIGFTGQFKHLYVKPGAELTADVNYNNIKGLGGNNILSTYGSGFISQEQQQGNTKGQIFTSQMDFINPLDNGIKLEGGVKATIRVQNFDNANSVYNYTTQSWEAKEQLTDKFKFNDDVFAAYIQGGKQIGKWGYQAGLRAESSIFKGSLTDRDSSFTIAYPIQLFPSGFLSYKLNDKDQLQFAYTRRVNRPNFFQTLPFTDFSDSLNLRRGNPALKPEFTNSLELSYQNIINDNHNFLASIYYKQASNLITSYLFKEVSSSNNNEYLITGYINSDRASAYGGEFTLKNTIHKMLDFTTNINVFKATVNANTTDKNLNVNRWTYFIKENIQWSLPKGFTLQLNGEYKSKASFTPSNNNDMFRGGFGGGQNSAQGYTKSFWYTDFNIKKSFWKNSASVTLSIQDIFSTRINGAFTTSSLFNQDTERIMNPKLVRVNFSYRFGKMDASLFKRKNNKVNTSGSDMMGG